MFNKALGYTDEEGNYHPPETTAGIFILKNMRSKLYQDRPKTQDEIDSIKYDNELKKLKIKLLSQAETEEFAEVRQLIEKLDQEVDNAKQ